jgi:hypothetical protein
MVPPPPAACGSSADFEAILAKDSKGWYGRDGTAYPTRLASPRGKKPEAPDRRVAFVIGIIPTILSIRSNQIYPMVLV